MFFFKPYRPIARGTLAYSLSEFKLKLGTQTPAQTKTINVMYFEGEVKQLVPGKRVTPIIYVQSQSVSKSSRVITPMSQFKNGPQIIVPEQYFGKFSGSLRSPEIP